MEIEYIVSKLLKQFNTRNPFSIAKYLNIEVLFAELGSSGGCYLYLKKHRCIIINCELDENEQHLVMAHELGHAVLHTKMNYYFMRNKTYLNTNKYEREANIFAAFLLISDDDVTDCDTVGHLSALCSVPEYIAELRLKRPLLR